MKCMGDACSQATHHADDIVMRILKGDWDVLQEILCGVRDEAGI